jgi:hypothetical protein
MDEKIRGIVRFWVTYLPFRHAYILEPKPEPSKYLHYQSKNELVHNRKFLSVLILERNHPLIIAPKFLLPPEREREREREREHTKMRYKVFAGKLVSCRKKK